MTKLSFVQTNMMEDKNYAPYCGRDSCFGRCPFNGSQFQCVRCGWTSKLDDKFISDYKEKWKS